MKMKRKRKIEMVMGKLRTVSNIPTLRANSDTDTNISWRCERN